MKGSSSLLVTVQTALAREPLSFESAAIAFDLIERRLASLGGVENTGVVLPGQLARFRRSLDWQADSPGRRMTIAEATAFLERLARASDAAAVGATAMKRGRPVTSR
jgi:hypothetical protein